MIKLIFFFPVILISWLTHSAINKFSIQNNEPVKSFVISGRTQGTTYYIKYLSGDSIISKHEIDSIFNVIDNALSWYIPTSRISNFNTSTKGILLDEHIRKVIEKSIEMSLLSKGYFDITSKPLTDLWGLGLKKIQHAPTKFQIKTVLDHVGINKLYIKNDSLIKLNANTEIDCNGIAQGYSVDVISEFLQGKNLKNFIVEIGGEIKTAGYNESGMPWVIGIENPNNFYDNEYFITKKIAISNMAVTTSGSYRKYKKLGAKYFSHIIDPIHGKPLENGIISVTVIAANAMQADGLDNVFMLLGIQDSFELLDQLPETGIYILYKNSKGHISDTCNLFFKKHLINDQGTSAP